MSVQWIISDIDGCLSPEESVQWDIDAFGEFAAIVRAASAGQGKLAPMTLCTGRPQPYVEVLLKLLDIRVPAICENGAVLYTLHNNHAWFGPGVTAEKVAKLGQVRAFIESDVLPRFPAALRQFGKEAQISVFSEDSSIFIPMRDLIAPFAAGIGLDLLINVSPCYLNISLTGVDKGSTVNALLNELSVSKEETAGIGDSEGDLPLRDAVGFFACPANAVPELQAVADYVSPYRDLAGVLDILKHPALQRP